MTGKAELIEASRVLGVKAALEFLEEFGETPADAAEDDPNLGDWDSMAWGMARGELEGMGATEADYAACFSEWRAWFMGGPTP